MANAPALLATYSFGWEVFDETSLSPVERQIVYQTANFENECNYCVPWHTLLVKQAGADTETVEALRRGSCGFRGDLARCSDLIARGIPR
ncbi:carboxymuconolactone decarboxylase family protein [Erythrobacter colymbi]|uniref:carboxymuconolactone decarboxylase family protein n=1 Tax=Erythrobacter colymbi TaxID=1161202 RepID=UPI003B830C6F